MWGNSHLNAVLCPRDQLWGPPPALLLEVGLSPHPCSQPLCFFQSLLGSSGSFGSLACHHAPTLSLYYFMHTLDHLELVLRIWLLVSPLFSGQVQHSTPHLVLESDYSLLVVFQFCWGGFSLSRGCAELFSWGGGLGYCAWCMMFTCSFCSFASHFGADCQGEMACQCGVEKGCFPWTTGLGCQRV
jgi:hypothetical protein